MIAAKRLLPAPVGVGRFLQLQVENDHRHLGALAYEKNRRETV
jgi:hypothetical protein